MKKAKTTHRTLVQLVWNGHYFIRTDTNEIAREHAIGLADSFEAYVRTDRTDNEQKDYDSIDRRIVSHVPAGANAVAVNLKVSSQEYHKESGKCVRPVCVVYNFYKV